MSGARESARQANSEQFKRIDDATKHRRLKKQLDALEQDNFQLDPHLIDGVSVKLKGPKAFDVDASTEQTQRKKRKRGDHFKQRFRKTFDMLLEEERVNNGGALPPYTSASAPPSVYPARHFCAVCGFTSDYVCVRCSTRYCSAKCLGVHNDTRCLKWTA